MPRRSKTPLRGELHQKLIYRIVEGSVLPGERLVESQLCKEFGVSRTPMREALFSLEREGFVIAEHDRGFSVSPLSNQEILERYPIMWSLEVLAVRFSGQSLSVLAPTLRKLNKEFSRVIHPLKATRVDTEWHQTLVSRCANKRLQHLIEAQRMLLARYEHVFMRDTKLISVSVKQHEAIIAAVETEDIDCAAQALERNWRWGMESLLLKLAAKN